MQLNFAREARADLAEILSYIAQDSPRAAAGVLDRIDDVIQRIVSGELQGPEARLLDGRRAQR
jgi:plasmid stabilization system protein ParE